MSNLSNYFKRSDVFKAEFDKIFPDEAFNKANILRYITSCTELVLAEGRNKYPEHGLAFVNPLFIVAHEIYPAPGLPGDPDVLKFTPAIFELVQSKVIIPLSIHIIDNLLSGVCLFHGNTAGVFDYKLFKTFNLDILPSIGTPEEVTEATLTEKISTLDVQVQKYPQSFVALADALGSVTDEQKLTLIKTLLVYKSMANALQGPLAISFVNKFHQTRSFFDCMFTLVSEQPFDEDELLDFAHIAESMALPIINFDYTQSKGISSHTMSKRHSLKEVLVDTFRYA